MRFSTSLYFTNKRDNYLFRAAIRASVSFLGIKTTIAILKKIINSATTVTLRKIINCEIEVTQLYEIFNISI